MATPPHPVKTSPLGCRCALARPATALIQGAELPGTRVAALAASARACQSGAATLLRPRAAGRTDWPRRTAGGRVEDGHGQSGREGETEPPASLAASANGGERHGAPPVAKCLGLLCGRSGAVPGGVDRATSFAVGRVACRLLSPAISPAITIVAPAAAPSRLKKNAQTPIEPAFRRAHSPHR